MKNLTIQELKQQIEPKRFKGDFITMSKMLGIDGRAAQKQYERCKPEAVIALYYIIEYRESLIKNTPTLIDLYKNNHLKQ